MSLLSLLKDYSGRGVLLVAFGSVESTESLLWGRWLIGAVGPVDIESLLWERCFLELLGSLSLLRACFGDVTIWSYKNC